MYDENEHPIDFSRLANGKIFWTHRMGEKILFKILGTSGIFSFRTYKEYDASVDRNFKEGRKR